MKAITPIRFLLLLATLMLFAPAALRAQDAKTALSNLPESQAVLYVNARRLINEAAPAVVPPEVLNKALADAKQFVDLNGLEYVIAGARLKGEVSAKQLPEFLLVVRGNFSADALLSGARMMAQGMYTEEKHGAKTINVFSFKKNAKPGENNPAAKMPVDEIAAVALDANTIAVGIPAYLKDAVDASAGGQGARLKPELVDLAVRDADTLVSLVADLPASMSQHLRGLGVPPNAEVDRMIDAVRQVQLSVNMLPSLFGLQSIVRMESPERAAALSGLVGMGVRFLEGELQKEVTKSGGKDEKAVAALGVLKSLTNTTRDNDVVLNVSFQQAALAEMVRKEMAPKPKKQESVNPAAGAKKGTAATRRRGRTRRK